MSVLAKDILPWVLHRIAARDHGCLDEDCGHEFLGECVAQLIRDYEGAGEPEEVSL